MFVVIVVVVVVVVVCLGLSNSDFCLDHTLGVTTSLANVPEMTCSPWEFSASFAPQKRQPMLTRAAAKGRV